ncbi:MAG: RNA-directed DNA polymerase [Planctomyces sp.]|nr:RNA-directed DNA polymerase [Planctomyces sp.]
MGLFAFLRRILFGAPEDAADDGGSTAPRQSPPPQSPATARRRRTPLPPLRYGSKHPRTPAALEQVAERPYQFANLGPAGRFLDLSTDADLSRLEQLELPRLLTPADVAHWLNMPPGRLAWLSGRFEPQQRAASEKAAHYHYRWIRKRSGGMRLIEAPKVRLRQVQTRILREILDHVAAHDHAHGFVRDRSALTNAKPHVGSYVVLKLDLENFYASVRYSRVVAIFRALGFSRAAALWLARLTTSAAPASLSFPDRSPLGLLPYLPRHLPQGAPTSPALANLSAWSLDVRLTGLAKKYHATYTRYADDLTFSGSHRFAAALSEFIPLAEKIIRSERFKVNRAKRKVLRRSGRQTVTGVVTNARPNIAREDYDRLKAILHNCVRRGPSTQNHDSRKDFQAHLRGRVAHVRSVHPARGAKLLALYQRIDWKR